MSAVSLVPLVALAVGLALDVWVYQDARQRAEEGHPVIFRAGSLVLDTPTLWLVGCLLLWIVFLPLYLNSRT